MRQVVAARSYNVTPDGHVSHEFPRHRAELIGQLLEALAEARVAGVSHTPVEPLAVLPW